MTRKEAQALRATANANGTITLIGTHAQATREIYDSKKLRADLEIERLYHFMHLDRSTEPDKYL